MFVMCVCVCVSALFAVCIRGLLMAYALRCFWNFGYGLRERGIIFSLPTIRCMESMH